MFIARSSLAIYRHVVPSGREHQVQTSYPVHGVEEIFSLSVNANTEVLTFASQSLLQVRGAFTRTRRVSDNHHREFALNHSLVDIDDTASCFREDLGNTCHDSRMVQAKN